MSEAAVEGGPDTEKPLATPAAGVMATACRDAPPCTPPLPADPSLSSPAPVPPPISPGWGGVAGGDRGMRDSRGPSKKSLPRAGLSVLPEGPL